MQPEVRSLELDEVKLVTPRRFGDARGWFSETWNAADWAAVGVDCKWVQDNHSYSRDVGVLRGLHFQCPPFAQAKLVRALKGRIFDVAVDIRAGSPTYGRWAAATLTGDGGEQLFVPRGFAHGFCTLAPDTEVAYKVDGPYASDHDAGLAWDDPDLAIEWPLDGAPLLSDKDGCQPSFADFRSPFSFENR